MQRMPSSLRSKIQSGCEKRSSVSTAFIASLPRGGRACAAASARPREVCPARSSSVLGGHILHGAAAEHGLGLGAHRVAARVGGLVAALHQQPLRLVAAARAAQRVAAAQLLALQPDRQVAAPRAPEPATRPRAPSGRCRCPTRSPPRAVLALADHALEVAVVERVVLHLHGQALVARVGGGALGHRPRRQRAVDLQPQVVVQAAAPRASGSRTADWARLALRSLGLLRALEVPLGAVAGKPVRWHRSATYPDT